MREGQRGGRTKLSHPHPDPPPSKGGKKRFSWLVNDMGIIRNLVPKGTELGKTLTLTIYPEGKNSKKFSFLRRGKVMQKQKSPSFLMGLLIPAFARTSLNLGNVLLSHTVTHAVPSALKGLTSVFGMGTGVSPSPWSPRNLKP